MTREENRNAGAVRRRAAGQPDDDPGLNAPGYAAMSMNITIRTFPAGYPPAEDRVIPALTALCFRGAEYDGTHGRRRARRRARTTCRYRDHPVGAGSGLPRTEEDAAANRVFAARGISLPGDPKDTRTVAQMDADGVANGKAARPASGRWLRTDNPLTFSLYQVPSARIRSTLGPTRPRSSPTGDHRYRGLYLCRPA